MVYKLSSDMNFNAKNDEPSFGFTTAKGRTINVSNKALSKAKKLYAEVLKETDNYEEILKAQSNEFNMQAPSAEFQIMNKDFAEKTIENPENVASSFVFKTGDERSISISDEALLKAKQTIESSCTHVVAKTVNTPAIATQALQTGEISSETVKYTENIFSIGFETAGGKTIKISDKALSRAMQLFNDDVEKETNSNINVMNNEFQTVYSQHLVAINKPLQEAEMLFPNKIVPEANNAMSSIGFTTAKGNSINVSEKALLNAKQLFISDLEDTEKPKETLALGKSVNEAETQVDNVGFQTRSSHSAPSIKGLVEAKVLLREETFGNFENNLALSKSLQKRKVTDLDDDVSATERIKSNQFKKLKFCKAEIVESNCTDSKSLGVKQLNNGSNSTNKTTTSKKNDIDNSFISNEIVESIVALLADENNFDIKEERLSPVASKEKEETIDLPSSPVIGGQLIPKKRRSIGRRKKSTIQTVKVEKNISASSHNLEGLNLDKCIKKESESLIVKEELKCKEIKSEISVNNEFGDSPLWMDVINERVTILEKRLEAALEQDKQISLKKKHKPRPTISKLCFHKKTNSNKRVSWKEISKKNLPVLCTYEELIQRKLPPEILNITAGNATSYKFRCTDFYGEDNIEGIQLEDGGYLILDEKGYVGIEEIKRSFLASPGVDPNLLPAGWVENHYKWILWKLASMDRVKFDSITLPRALTPANVMMQLKYRYDREIDKSERPALRKILEKDDAASKRMVLCVSSIYDENDDPATADNGPIPLKTPSKKLILTDGWYSVPASIDYAMVKNIISGKVKEGTKLMIYGSELLNCDQGCSPLEALENVCLKIHTNSTRRAKWDTKLGYVAPIGPMCIKLGSVCSNGGLIGRVKVFIARVYPILYYEKTSDGESIYRNARCEEKATIAFEKECRSKIESFYVDAEKYFSPETRKSKSDPDSMDLAAMEWNEDRDKLSRDEFSSKLEQEQLLINYRIKEEQFRKKLESRLQENLPPPRQVTQILKVRVVDEDTNAILSVWSPSEEIIDALKEGNFISISNITPSARRGNEMQLTASRNAIFNRTSIPNVTYPPRSYTVLSDVNKPTFAPAYGEFDTVGFVISVGNEPYGMKNFQAAYLAYPHTNSQSSYLSVLFWQGISSHGYAEILTVGSFIACSNLEWRRATSWNVPMAYCTERSTFTRNPKQSHLQQPFEDLKRLIPDIDTYVTTCAAAIAEEIQKKSTTRISDQYTPNKTLFNDRFNLDKSIGNSTPQEVSAKSLLSNQTTARSIAIQRRLEKLQYYGEPSSLSPVVLNNSSKRVSLEFQSPVRSSNASNRNGSLNDKFSQNLR